MGYHIQPFTRLNAPLVNCSFCTQSKGPLFSRKPFMFNPLITAKRAWNWDVSLFRGICWKNPGSWRMKNRTVLLSAAQEGNGNAANAAFGKKRKVVEHICLLRERDDLSDKLEQDMLDYLYTTQYHMREIVAVSLGRVSDQENAKYTHAIFMRFQKKDLTRFYDNPFYLGVLRDHVFPNCHNIINVDYESEVEDDILPIFQKGELEFNYGVEFVLLIAFNKNSLGRPAEKAMTALAKLTTELPSLIV